MATPDFVIIDWIVFINKGLNRSGQSATIEILEERRRVPLPLTHIDDGMHSVHEEIGGLSHEAIGNFHAKGSGNRLDLDPATELA